MKKGLRLHRLSLLLVAAVVALLLPPATVSSRFVSLFFQFRGTPLFPLYGISLP
jgi:hypothetical protein